MLKFVLLVALLAGVFMETSVADGDSDSCAPPPRPLCRRANEVYEICPQKCPFRTCGIDDRLIDCIPQPQPGDKDCPPPKCRCKPQFFRDDKGNCVPWEECPKCGENEEYDACDARCPERTCAFDPTLVLCKPPPKLGDEDCVAGCRCKDGYLRNDKGRCIPRDQCPPKCKKNEVWNNCPNCNPQTCDTIDKPLPCPKGPCKGACRCKEGYVRDNNGDCVPKSYCSKCTKPNEVYYPCPIDCSPQTCETRNNSYSCPNVPADPCDPRCKPACRCKHGYFRNKIGECISAEDCARCPGDHEYWSCGPACDNRCDSKYGQDNCNIINVKCNPMCYCEKGYARATNETCIPKEDCPYECPKNEEYHECPDNLCIAKKCSDAGYPLDCPPVDPDCPCPGKPGCICIHGHLRDCNGRCVPTTECPSCGGDKNSTSGCGTNCGKRCSDYDKKDKNCVLMCYPNGCECRDGYVYDDNTKKCVLPCDCTPVCKENEVYSTCINDCKDKYCTDLNKKDNVCVEPTMCKDGCVCAKGFLRNSKGICVPIEKCDNCPDNEEYNECPDAVCKPKKCSDLGYPLNCTDVKPGDSCPGKPGCMCKPSYLRDCNGVCIPEENCPSCGGDKNATLGCGTHCGNTCADYDKKPENCPIGCIQNGCNCRKGYVYDTNKKQCVLPCDCSPVCKENEVYSTCINDCKDKYCTDLNKKDNVCVEPTMCKDGCVCAKGFLRNSKGICVPIEKCDNCPDNEEYTECPDAVCKPKKCSDLGYPLNCTDVKPGDPCPGKPGCMCKPSYLRDCNGVCVPEENCPSCGGDKNATLGCGTHCGNTCADYDKKPENCPIGCIQNGCNCRKGYVYDTNKKQCVLPCDCSPVCKKHEVYSPCFNGGCDKKYCTDLGKPDICIDPICKEGCICEKGYLKNSKGDCVPIDQCDNCPPNEVYSECPDHICAAKKCSELGYPLNCSVVYPDDPCPGKPGCVCKDDYLRNDKGVCVPVEKCPSCAGDKNATLGCSNYCGNSCDDYNKKSVACAQYCIQNGCGCRKNYVYDHITKKCVLPCDCIKCPPNEQYDFCDASCPARRCDFDPTVVRCKSPPKIGDPECVIGCRCRDGYLRNAKGICVPKEECPPKCKKNEEWNPSPDCNPQTCETIDKIMPCDGKPCKGACRCKEGYVRDKNGDCVPVDTCYKCPKNEVYNKCPASLCRPKKCSDLGYPLNCITVNPGDPCLGKPGCICKDDYVRNCDGICIPIKDCPSCGGDKNATMGCGTNCGRLCSNYNKGPVACPRSCKYNACDCRDKYVFDSNTKKCVLPCDCTPVCKKNEVYSTCANNGCDKKYCSDLNKPDKCVRHKICKVGCVCAKGYLRNGNGDCIPIDKCPKTCS